MSQIQEADIQIFLAKNLRYLRKKRSLTQGQIAIKLKVKPKTYQAWEEGRGNPDNKRLAIIAQFYNVSLDDLILKYLGGISSHLNTNILLSS